MNHRCHNINADIELEILVTLASDSRAVLSVDLGEQHHIHLKQENFKTLKVGFVCSVPAGHIHWGNRKVYLKENS